MLENLQKGHSPSPPVHLRLILPASESNVNLCKTLLSAAVLDYPTPMLINWNTTYNNPDLIFGGSHIAKIEGVLKYLRELGTRNENDLALVVDGYDSWFQLRPQLLIDRYYEINQAANARIHKQIGKGAYREGISQRVIFSAQKRCWPKGKNHPACFAVPQSSLPNNVYGPRTDTNVGDKKNPFLKYRQRYLNSGLAMGPVKDLRAIFEQAYKEACKDTNFGSDQSIFTAMFGYQEFQRHVIAYRNRSWIKVFTDWTSRLIGKYESILEPDKAGSHHLMEPASGTPYEFGIGLDYEMKISHPTVFAEFDTEWVKFNDPESLSRSSMDKGITTKRLQDVPKDITYSVPPFFSLRRTFPSGSLPTGKTWKNVSLFANLWTGSVPAIIHHNAHMDGLKSRLETHWNRTWFQPYGRPLLEAHVIEPSQAIARSPITEDRPMEWWSANADSGGVETDKGQFITYEQICKDSWEEIFDDGRGVWNDPRGDLKYSEAKPNKTLDSEL